jgi:hypothetical protein
MMIVVRNEGTHSTGIGDWRDYQAHPGSHDRAASVNVAVLACGGMMSLFTIPACYRHQQRAYRESRINILR